MVTNSESPLPCYAAKSGFVATIFGTSIGKLQQHLHKGEYYMFRSTLMFESDFVQITKSGELIDVHNHMNLMTMGVACTSPILPIPTQIPDVVLLARQATSCEQCHSQAPKRKKCKAEEPLELTRLLPLKFVKISVHDRKKQQLHLKFATGRSFYLQLRGPLDACEDLFTCWESLIDLLQPPFESISGTYATPAEDILCLPALADADRASLAASDAHSRDYWDQVSIHSVHSDLEVTGATSDDHGRDYWDQVSIRSVHSDPKVTRATSAAYASGEGDQPSSRTSTGTPKVYTPKTRSGGSAEESAPGTKREAAAARVASGVPSVEASQENTALPEAAFIGEGGSKSPVAGPGGAKAGQQGTPKASKASRKEHRERKERREDRPLSRSSYHRRTREGHHKTEGDKMAQKSSSRSSSGHRTHRVNKNEGGHLRAKSSRHSHSPKGLSHTRLEKEPRSSNKSRRSLSAVSSESTPKRLSRFSSFLENIRANLGMKGAASLHGGKVDTVPKRVEETDLEATAEMAEFGQGVEVDSETSMVKKKVTFRSPLPSTHSQKPQRAPGAPQQSLL
ncbi:protein FAM71A [Heterocephalus glaber]|uniref:Protein FAM71A n=1 Tax=Heterocephalus glaber TaxID=10181 RepID=A0AAX6P1W1_HETGA|nr:protein FAM71A [Heterocephalus glaber]